MHYNLIQAMDLFLQAQDPQLTKATIDNKRHYIDKFLEFLDKQECHNFNGFDINLAYEFVESLDYASQTLSNVQFAIRNFFDTLHDRGMSDIDGRMVFPIIFTNKRDRILSYYQPDEIKSLINAIDTSRPNGVRDKCWVLLAAQTGLRSRDILQLKFDEILWDKHVISKKQQKTGLPVTVALPENLELLLIDYIKNHRPSSDLEYVFICADSGERFCNTSVYPIVHRYFQKAEVSIRNRKHGPHALRHSLASSLLQNNTPMPVITGILGHKDLNTTSKYLSIDVEHLRKCCLEVPYEN